jgi:hypothetical protein
VEDGGAEKLPLLRVAVLGDAPFFVMARSRGGSPSPAWWKGRAARGWRTAASLDLN